MRPRRSLAVFFLFLALGLSACAAPNALSPRDKKKADAARDLGEAYLREKRYTAALAELYRAKKINPGDPILHHNIGLVFMAMGKSEPAVDHFKEAVRLNPEYSLAKNSLGSAYLVLEEWDQAIAVLEEVTADLLYATPHYPLTNLGWAYYNKGDFEKSRQYLEEALEVQPDFFLARLNLGRVYRATGQLQKALRMFEKAAEINPQSPQVLLALGKTYRLLGDYGNARLALKGAIELGQDEDLVLEASRELQKLY
jgi:tetratricopeptide (TPR) repeat protein